MPASNNSTKSCSAGVARLFALFLSFSRNSFPNSSAKLPVPFFKKSDASNNNGKLSTVENIAFSFSIPIPTLLFNGFTALVMTL